MKTLYEGILSDIEDTIKDGDKYIDAVKELDVTKKLTTKDWEPILGNDVYVYTVKCPKWLKMIGVNNLTQIYFEISIYKEDNANYEAAVDIRLTNDDYTDESFLIRGIMADGFDTHGKNAKRLIYQAVNRAIKNSVNSKNSEKLRKIILSHL
jgi:hypothetical protein